MSKLTQNFRLAWKSPNWRWALLIAVLSDTLGFGVVLFPPVQWILDAATAIAFVIVFGFRWKLLAALAIEVIPAIQLFPAWTLVVLAMAADDNYKSHASRNISATFT